MKNCNSLQRSWLKNYLVYSLGYKKAKKPNIVCENTKRLIIMLIY